MASTVSAARLTEAHRLTQARLGAQTVAQMRTVWPLLDPQNLDGTFPGWLRAAQVVIAANRATSSQLAAAYYSTFRLLELGIDVPAAVSVFAETVTVEQLATSLLVTGPIALKQALARSVNLATAARHAEVSSARAAMRHALNGGRDTIVGTMQADDLAFGYARAASGSACAFCALLASRGPVYSKETVDFQAHDGCHCTSEPVFDRNADWPAGSRHYRDLYDEAAKGTSDPLNEFRRALA